MVTGSSAPAGLKYYVWWFPGSPVRVHLSLDVVDRLREQLQLAGPKAAGEGLLLGKPLEGATEVFDFQPVAGSVPEAAAAQLEGAGNQRLVGYYRTEFADSLRLNERDQALARASFTQPHHVFLLIQPTGFGPPTAGFFFHDRDGKMPEFSLMEFPFESSLLAGEERDRLRRSEQAAERRSAAVQAPAPSQTRPDGRRRGVLPVVVLLSLLTLVAGIAAGSRYFQAGRPRPGVSGAQPAPPAPPVPALSALAMGLRAKREGGDVQITWNRESPVIAGAVSGALTIREGHSHRDIPLDSGQLLNSTIVYTPTADQVSIQLAITTPVSTVIESVMLLLPGNSPPKPPAPVSPPAAKPPEIRQLKPFTPPSPAPSGGTPGMPSLPLLQAGPAGSLDADSIPVLIAAAAAPPPPSRNPDSNGPGGTPVSAAFRPAEPLRRIVPRLAPPLLTLISKPATIEVRVAIDKTGHVTQAEAVPHAGAHRVVIDKLVEAARAWTFSPARRGDEPIASEFVLQFHFSN